MIVFNYGLECVTILVIAYISYSVHRLFDYKLVLVFFIFGGLNVHRCFTHFLNFHLSKISLLTGSTSSWMDS